MPVNDPIADMLVRIKNAANASFPQVSIPYSRMKESIAKILESEGFVKGLETAGEGIRRSLIMELKYKPDGKPVFSTIKRESKLGRRRYIGAYEIKPSRQGMGVAILSTSKGVMKDTDAKRQGVGGEVLCTIW